MKEGLFEIQFLRVINLCNQDIYLRYNKYLYYVRNLCLMDQVQLINVEFHDVEHKNCLIVPLLFFVS